jgi:hypothetical protein
MRKTLLGCTAIVGASMLGVAVAEASDPPELKFDGFLRFEAKFADQDYDIGRKQTQHFESDDAGFNLNAAATADNGLKYAAKIEIDTDGAQAGVDELLISFSGDWGKLELGDEDGAEDNMAYGGENVACLGECGYDGGASSVFNFMGVRKGNPNLGTGGGDTSDASKITYFTPRTSGFRLGVSYTPDSGANLASDIETNTLKDDKLTDIRNAVGVGFDYVSKVGEADFRAHVTGTWASIDSDMANTLEDPRGYMVGMGLGWMGWRLGLGYGNAGDGMQIKGGDEDNGEWISTGLGYSTGPYTFALGYFMGEANGEKGEEETDFFTVQTTYNAAPGLQIYAEFDWIDVNNPSGLDADDSITTNEGVVLTLGTRVTF